MAGLDYDVVDRSLQYVNVSTGFEEGGFFYGPPGANTYQPEHVTSYVNGSKNRFAGNRVQLNLKVFCLDYTNQQVSFVKLVGPSTVLVTENVGSSTAHGVDFELSALLGEDTQPRIQGECIDANYDELPIPPSHRQAASACVRLASQVPASSQRTVPATRRRGHRD